MCASWHTDARPVPCPYENAAIIYTFMGCCKLAQLDVRKWLNHFFTHIHEYDNDYSRDLLEQLPHNLKQKDIL